MFKHGQKPYWPLSCRLGGVNPRREFLHIGKGVLGFGGPASRGSTERVRISQSVSARGDDTYTTIADCLIISPPSHTFTWEMGGD